MSRSIQKSGVAIHTHFRVYNTSDAAVTGLADGAFTKVLVVDGASSAVTVTVTEVASGVYTATFTPNAVGLWSLWITHATHNPRGWAEDFDVTAGGVLDGADIDGKTPVEALKLIAAVLAGKVSGGPDAPVFRSLDDGANRVSMTADENGNRSAVTLNV